MRHNILLLTAFAVLGCGAFGADDRTCGLESVLAWAALRGCDLPRIAGSEAVVRARQGNPQTLQELALLASGLGQPVEPVKGTLQELLAFDEPLIIHLKSPDHWTVLLDASGDDLRLVEGPSLAILRLRRAQVAERFDGYALLRVQRTASRALAVPAAGLDLGPVTRGASKSVQIAFKNTGTETLQAQLLRKSCSCTDVSPSSLSVSPGATEHITVRVQPKDGLSYGESVVFQTTADNRPILILSVYHQDSGHVVVVPDRLSMFSGGRGFRQSGYRVRLIGPTGFALRSAVSEPEYVDVRVVNRTIGAHGSTVVEIELMPRIGDIPTGVSAATVTIASGEAETPPIRIPVSIQRTSELIIDPEQVVAEVRKGTPLHQRVVVRWRSAGQCQIGGVSCTDSRVGATASSRGDETGVDLVIPAAAAGLVDCVVRFIARSDGGGEAVGSIKVTVKVVQ